MTTNRQTADRLKKDHAAWKTEALNQWGYFPIFHTFRDLNLLRDLSPNAIRLYIYLGLSARNMTGETFVSLETIAKYFKKTPRAVSNWVRELEENGLIKRLQMNPNGVAFTYLMPYGLNELNRGEEKNDQAD